jgi:hypothetical protein
LANQKLVSGREGGAKSGLTGVRNRKVPPFRAAVDEGWVKRKRKGTSFHSNQKGTLDDQKKIYGLFLERTSFYSFRV